MVRWNWAGIHPVMHGEWAVGLGKKFPRLLDHRRESAVESDHEPAVRGTRVRSLDRIQFFFRQAKRLLAKNVLTGF
jgi:hypothetical protein